MLRSVRSRRTAWLAERLERLAPDELAAIEAALEPLSRLLEGRSEARARSNARTFASLRRHRNYRLYFIGQIVSLSGTWMQNIALAWLIVELTHSPVAVGLLAFVRFAPFAVFGLPAGVLADRFDNRRVMMLTQAVSMVVSAVLAALACSGHPTALGDLRPRAARAAPRRLRRAEPSRADLPAGRPRRAPECGRAQREPLQRLARGRARDRRRRDRGRRRRRLLRRSTRVSFLAVLAALALMRTPRAVPARAPGSAADDQGRPRRGSATRGGRPRSASSC